MDLKTLRNDRGKAIADARAILDKANEENRDLDKDEDVEYGKYIDLADTRQKQIEREERQQELERSAAAIKLEEESAGREQGKVETPEEKRTENIIKEFRSYLISGRMPAGAESEFRALQADADITGGFLVAPEQFVKQLIKNVDDQVFIRQLATVIPVQNAASLGVPSLDTDPADPTWTSEIGAPSEDSSMALGKRKLEPQPLAKLVKVSQKLLRISAIPAEQLVGDRLAYKFGIAEEKGFLTGSGANQPLGVFTASSNGIPTGRDVSTGNTTTEIRFDGLINAKYNQKGQYWSRAQWIFHRDALKQIATLKDGDGQYIWQPSKVLGEPDRLLNMPYNMSEYAPNTFTTGLYVGILGDFSNYWIADSLAMQIQRLVELYAGNNQVGFIGRAEVDGMPVLSEAFTRVKLA